MLSGQADFGTHMMAASQIAQWLALQAVLQQQTPAGLPGFGLKGTSDLFALCATYFPAGAAVQLRNAASCAVPVAPTAGDRQRRWRRERRGPEEGGEGRGQKQQQGGRRGRVPARTVFMAAGRG